MKKRTKKKKGDLILNLKIDISRGIYGLKVSLIALILLTIFFLIYLINSEFAFYEIFKVMFRFPDSRDILAIFGFFILFIVAPFVISLKFNKKIK